MSTDSARVQLLEALAELHHNNWMQWSKEISSHLKAQIGAIELESKLGGARMSPESSLIVMQVQDRLARWESLWIPYSELSDDWKEYDREFARKAMYIMDWYAR